MGSKMGDYSVSILIGLLLALIVLLFGSQFFGWVSRLTKSLSDKLNAKADEIERRNKE